MSKSLLRSLKNRKDVVARIIARRQRDKGYDSVKISELKKLRLSLKDQIARIEATYVKQKPSF